MNLDRIVDFYRNNPKFFAAAASLVYFIVFDTDTLDNTIRPRETALIRKALRPGSNIRPSQAHELEKRAGVAN
jgi:hypothetical protein